MSLVWHCAIFEFLLHVFVTYLLYLICIQFNYFRSNLIHLCLLLLEETIK